MARTTFENNAWIPEEQGSGVITTVQSVSAVEALARKEPMATDVKNFARHGDVDIESIAKGAAYGEDTALADSVTLTARKFGKAVRIAEEDIEDSKNVDIINTKKESWASSYARFIDNATLGVTAAANGSTVPFESVYRAVNSAGYDGYVAGTNLVATAGAIEYADLDAVLTKVEGGNYYDESQVVVIAHPAFKSTLRTLEDGAGRLIFQDRDNAGVERLFGLPIRWSNGAKTSATATKAPGGAGGVAGTAGNPLLIVANKQHLILGVRSGPESVLIDGRGGLSALTDETILKMRARRGFSIGVPQAMAVLEVTTA
jgi:HK97 family phage major capsid protein